jgi:hypothetical protein
VTHVTKSIDGEHPVSTSVIPVRKQLLWWRHGPSLGRAPLCSVAYVTQLQSARAQRHTCWVRERLAAMA